MEIILTEKQEQASKILNNPNKIYILLDGGSSSGKSQIFILDIIERALKWRGSIYLLSRLRFSHAKSSIWHQTLLPLLKGIPGRYWKQNKADWYIEFYNGSEIWLGAFDEKERMEKILGHEYNIVYINEVSQLSYEALEMAIPRLRKYIPGFINKVYMDCNPPSPLHWIYRMFHQHLNPRTLQPIEKPELYAQLKINPIDNVENLPPGYIENNLKTMSQRGQQRFLYGEYVKAEGVIYENLEEEHIINRDDLPDIEYYTIGIDFGLHMAAVLLGWVGDHIYIVDDYGGVNCTTSTFDSSITERWVGIDYIAYCPHDAAERKQEVTNADNANVSVEPGIDYINTKIERGELHICENAVGVLAEIYDYRRDDKERIVKTNDHYMDAMRYGIFSRAAVPPQIFL